MKNIKKYIALALSGVMALSLAGCNIIERTPESMQKTVIAKVNGQKITRGDLDEAMKAEIDQYIQEYGEDYATQDTVKDTFKESQLENVDYLVEEKVLLQKAKDFDVVPSDEDIEAYIAEQETTYKGYFSNDEDKYESYIESMGYTMDKFKELLKNQCIINAAIEEMVKDVEATDEELQSYYDENKDEFTQEAGAAVTHILFTGDNAEQNAKDAKALTRSGKTFEEIAAMDKYKDVAQYQDLGHINFENSGLVTEFENAFKVLPVNTVSEPVKTSFGWHLILNSKINTEKIVPTFEDKKAEIESTVLNNKKKEEYNTKLDQYKEDMKSEVFEDKIK